MVMVLTTDGSAIGEYVYYINCIYNNHISIVFLQITLTNNSKQYPMTRYGADIYVAYFKVVRKIFITKIT